MGSTTELDLRELERSHRVLLNDLTHKYKNRLSVPLERDHFLERMRAFLETQGIHYARVPIRSQQEVYYFFYTLKDTQIFLAEFAQLNPDH